MGIFFSRALWGLWRGYFDLNGVNFFSSMNGDYGKKSFGASDFS
jgi:hypothetical protein